jgi:hypothetical protein
MIVASFGSYSPFLAMIMKVIPDQDSESSRSPSEEISSRLAE